MREHINISLLVGPSFESDIVSEGSHLGLGHKAGPGSHPQAPGRCGNEGHLVWTLSETRKEDPRLFIVCHVNVDLMWAASITCTFVTVSLHKG